MPTIKLPTFLQSLFAPRIVYREVNSLEDFEFVISRCLAESEAGHFSEIYTVKNQDIQDGLKKQMGCAALGKPYPLEPWNPRNGTGSMMKIIEVKKQKVGFVLLLEDMPGSKNEKIELHLLSILPEFRGQGIGKDTVKVILKTMAAREIYARCYSKSLAMIDILRKAGFEVTDETKLGTKTLTIRR